MYVERYICASCGAIFTDPNVHSWDEDMNGEGAWEHWTKYLCPECGSDSVEEYDGEEEYDG